MINFFIGFLLVVFFGVSGLLILAILMQRSKQDGLGAAFGGGLTESVFGAQTSTILIRFTSWLIGIFFLSAIALAWLYGHRGRQETDLSRRLHGTPAAQTAPATPAPKAP
ncbi:MAG: preprotein translocase subunit SecG [Verrucomicrobium sp.]|nr:preprotein translocase subunit SecG [Verrucomicrobium sp.]